MELLSNNVVALIPIQKEHASGILTAAQFPEIWTYMSVTLSTLPEVEAYIGLWQQKARQGSACAFTVVDQQTQQIVGVTTFMDISTAHRHLEIGSTWYTPSVWRSAVNTNCKYLLLQYAFETMNMQRVQIKTGHENKRSQRAIERIGATKEGVLRNHMVQRDGRTRHTVMYSIIAEEWPHIKQYFKDVLQVN